MKLRDLLFESDSADVMNIRNYSGDLLKVILAYKDKMSKMTATLGYDMLDSNLDLETKLGKDGIIDTFKKSLTFNCNSFNAKIESYTSKLPQDRKFVKDSVSNELYEKTFLAKLDANLKKQEIVKKKEEGWNEIHTALVKMHHYLMKMYKK